MTAIGVRAEIQAGALLLDEQMSGWISLIDAERLQMESASDDILGQIFGGPHGFYMGLGILNISLQRSFELGFTAQEPNTTQATPEQWRRLGYEWLIEIHTRRKAIAIAAAAST